MKFGIEKEAFLGMIGSEELVLVPDKFPMDDCGWLVEYRGRATNDIFQAVGSVLAEEAAVCREMLKAQYIPQDIDYTKIPKKLRLAARREHIKGRLKYQNLYGLNPTSFDTAGVHISFTKPSITKDKDGYERVFNLLWDFPTLFKALDKRYAEQIKKAKRKPGFYEIKSDQRIEYRSLPASIDLWDVAEFIKWWSF